MQNDSEFGYYSARCQTEDGDFCIHFVGFKNPLAVGRRLMELSDANTIPSVADHEYNLKKEYPSENPR